MKITVHPIEVEVDLIDMVAEKTTQIEIMPEVGLVNTFKLYVHNNGKTVIRICKIKLDQINFGGIK